MPIYEAGENDGQAFYAMEFVEGRSLAELTRGKPLAPPGACTAVMFAAHYAHGQGASHRDLKPSNLLMPSIILASQILDWRGPWMKFPI